MDHPNYWEELYETRDIQFALESVTTIIATSEQLKTPDWSEETRKAFRKLLNGGLDLLDEGNLQAETGDFLINAMISRIIFDIGLKLYPLNEGFVDKRDAAMAVSFMLAQPGIFAQLSNCCNLSVGHVCFTRQEDHAQHRFEVYTSNKRPRRRRGCCLSLDFLEDSDGPGGRIGGIRSSRGSDARHDWACG